MKWNAKAFIPVLAVGALALSGCGGDSGSGSGPSTPTQPEVIVVNGEITSDTTWTANNQYLIQGALFVRTGATLTIQAGTTIFGDQATTGTLVVDRGGRSSPRASAQNPIVFTSTANLGSRARGQWGGLILNGFAPLNMPGGEEEGEGGTGFGGNDPMTRSGCCATSAWSSPGSSSAPTTSSTASPSRAWGAAPAATTSRSTSTRTTASSSSAARAQVPARERGRRRLVRLDRRLPGKGPVLGRPAVGRRRRQRLRGRQPLQRPQRQPSFLADDLQRDPDR